MIILFKVQNNMFMATAMHVNQASLKREFDEKFNLIERKS